MQLKRKVKVAIRDWVDYQASSLLHYINVIVNLFIMRNYFNELRSQQSSTYDALSHHRTQVPKVLGARKFDLDLVFFSTQGHKFRLASIT